MVHLPELSRRSSKTDLETAHLAEPAFASGFVDAGSQVVSDLEKAGALSGIGAKQRAANTGVLVNAWRRVGPAAGAECQLATLEVAEELLSLLLGRDPVLL